MSDDYGLSSGEETKTIAAPPVAYQPAKLGAYKPKIGLIGAGGITQSHLNAYKALGLEVVAIADPDEARAKDRQKEFYPDAKVYTEATELLKQEDVELVDVATHVDIRIGLVEAALNAGKHVLSQKPFCLKKEDGQRLVDLAAAKGVKLAVNQNGRWAPHFAYLRQAIADGLVGEVTSVDLTINFDQTWIANIPAFNSMSHMVLYDFAIHWFDITHCFLRGHKAESVYASVRKHSGQKYDPPALAGVVISYEDALVTLAFNAHTLRGCSDSITVIGTQGTMSTVGPGLNEHAKLDLFTEEGNCTVDLEGSWFQQGFQGTMAELVSAIEQDRVPYNNAADVLPGLDLCFAAMKSADEGRVVEL